MRVTPRADRRGDEARRPLLIVLGVVVVALFAGGGLLAEAYTDLIWYDAMGQTVVFWTDLLSRLAVWAGFGALFFVVLYANVLIARRFAPKTRVRPMSVGPGGPMPGGPGPQFDETLERMREQIEPFVRWVLVGGSLFLAFLAGAALADSWPVFQLALHAQEFGTVDPQFGRDVGFYVFTLPALRLVADWLFGALIVILLATAAVHLLDGAIRPRESTLGFAPHVKAHLSVLAASILVVKALDYYLSIFELNYSMRGQVLGASYTDVNAQIPAFQILIVIALIAAAVFLVNIRHKGWKLPAVALGLWIAASLLAGQVYPALVQQFRVEPNEIAVETPYIERNILATRQAYDLEDVATVPFPAEQSLTSQDIEEGQATIDNVRLWDPEVVVESYKQLQEIRFYYDFNDVDIDRYTIDGDYRQVLVSVREMNANELSEQAKTWVNRHLVYTHGYGAVVSPVNLATSEGFPRFLVRDIPPQTQTDLEVTQPRVYFGEETFDYVIAGTDLDEFDYPVGDENATNTYDGAAGVEAGGVVRRAAFALRFGSAKLLLSDYIRPDSKVLFRRTITERVGALARFLDLDQDPYPAIVDGRLTWILDGYTTSRHYPYAERFVAGGINYIRNSVKVTVDAYDGTVTLYGFDEEDPVLEAWSEIYPGLITYEELPDDAYRHLRYPEGLFAVQAEVYKTYHMTDPVVFYNKEDQWELPGAEAGTPMRPFYVMMRLPEEDTEELILMQPFTPRTKDNMIGWMAARMDGEEYGSRLVFQFPKQRLILGPEQVEARINQDPVISQQLSLWNQRGSNAILGNLLVIPIEDAIVFIQPLYLRSEQTSIPQLTRVIVASADKVAMEPDLETALAVVFDVDIEGAGEPTTEPTDGEAGPPEEAETALELLERLQRQVEEERTEFDALSRELQRTLESLLGTDGASAPTTPTP